VSKVSSKEEEKELKKRRTTGRMPVVHTGETPVLQERCAHETDL
jgi:hypothetical protein